MRSRKTVWSSLLRVSYSFFCVISAMKLERRVTHIRDRWALTLKLDENVDDMASHFPFEFYAAQHELLF